METLLTSLVIKVLPAGLAMNPWFVIGVLGLWLFVSELMPFVKDPRYGWLAKYDGPLHLALGILSGMVKRLAPSIPQTAGEYQPAQKPAAEAATDLGTADEAVGKK